MAQGNNMMKLSGYAPLLLVGLMMTSSLQAADPENLEFIGTLVTPPSCSISEDGWYMSTSMMSASKNCRGAIPRNRPADP
jgi:type 1 fimbria pilin